MPRQLLVKLSSIRFHGISSAVIEVLDADIQTDGYIQQS